MFSKGVAVRHFTVPSHTLEIYKVMNSVGAHVIGYRW